MEAQVAPINLLTQNLDPADHTHLRSLAQKAFMPRMVENLRPHVCDGGQTRNGPIALAVFLAQDTIGINDRERGRRS